MESDISASTRRTSAGRSPSRFRARAREMAARGIRQRRARRLRAEAALHSLPLLLRCAGAVSCSRRSRSFQNTTQPAPRRRCSRPMATRSRRWSDARVLVEFGSGSSRKTSLLIEALGECRRLRPDRHRRRKLAGRRPSWLVARHQGLEHQCRSSPISPRRADAAEIRAQPAQSSASSPARPSAISPTTKRGASCAAPRACLGKGSVFLIGVDLKKDETDPAAGL